MFLTPKAVSIKV